MALYVFQIDIHGQESLFAPRGHSGSASSSERHSIVLGLGQPRKLVTLVNLRKKQISSVNPDTLILSNTTGSFPQSPNSAQSQDVKVDATSTDDAWGSERDCNGACRYWPQEVSASESSAAEESSSSENGSKPLNVSFPQGSFARQNSIEQESHDNQTELKT